MEQMRKILLIFARILLALNLFKTYKNLEFSLSFGVLSLSKPFLSKMRLIGVLWCLGIITNLVILSF